MLKMLKTNKDVHKSYYFLALLACITIALFFANKTVSYLESENRLPHLNPKDQEFFEYLYMFSYAMFAGILIFNGLKYMKPLFHSLAGNEYLGNLMITSVLNMFSLACAAFIEEILTTFLGAKLQLTPWKNFTGYSLGRATVVALIAVYVLYFSTSKK